MHIVDASTRYSECTIMAKRCEKEMATAMKNGWVLRHSAPRQFFADSEISKDPMRKFLATNDITLAERPLRRHKKTGIVQHKQKTVRTYWRGFRATAQTHQMLHC